MTSRSGPEGAPRGATAANPRGPISRVPPADLEGLQPGNVTAVLDDRAPVVVVDLDEPALSPGHLPVAFPGVVVGVSRTGWPAASRSASAAQSPDPGLVVGVDIVLVAGSGARGGPSRGAPWVVVEDADAELVRIGEAAARSPIAAVTLMQVLRSGAADSLERDLVVESLGHSALQSGPEFL